MSLALKQIEYMSLEQGAKQTTCTILMIEPVSFGFNEETASNNYFQQKDTSSASEVQLRGLDEFKNMLEKLQTVGIDIIAVRDTSEPHTPDSVFPNNWISFHTDGRVAIYPMYAKNRRAERRMDIVPKLQQLGFKVSNLVDYTSYEEQHRFLEGTGSMVLDHENKIAYAAISERTNKELFLQFCKDFKYKPFHFVASQAVNGKRLPIYHTNVMMCVADQYCVVCLDTIDKAEERFGMIGSMVKTGKEIIEISEEQMHSFAGNMLQVENKEGSRFLIMSQSAYVSLTRPQLERLMTYNKIITIPIPTIEKYGGGSVRCMMAEVFNRKISDEII